MKTNRRPPRGNSRHGARGADNEPPVPRLTTQLLFAREPGAARSRVLQSPVTNAILLATDGGEGCSDAVILAMAMARQDMIPLQILSVVEPLPLQLDSDLAAMPAIDVSQQRDDHAHHRVRAQMRELFGRDDPVGINVEFGKPGEIIVRKAREWSSRLIILGLGERKGLLRRHAGGTAKYVAMHTATPTLVVAPGRWRIPRVVVAGTDFSDASLASIREASAVAAENALLHVVHVRPKIDFPQVDPEAWTAIYSQGVETLFGDLTAHVRALRSDMSVRSSVTSGGPADALRNAAISVGADVIAVGRQSLSRFDRFWLGSTTEALLAETPCSVLVTPAVERAANIVAASSDNQRISPAAV